MTRSMMFIDGPYLYRLTRGLGSEVDYRKMLPYFRKTHSIMRACYYTYMVETEEHDPQKPLTDWLSYNGYVVTVRKGWEHIDPDSGKRHVRGSIDADMTADMVHMAAAGKIDTAVVFAGDQSFVRPFQIMASCGVRIDLVSSLKTNGVRIADDLRRASDNFIELETILSHFERIRDDATKAKG